MDNAITIRTIDRHFNPTFHKIIKVAISIIIIRWIRVHLGMIMNANAIIRIVVIAP